jgi:hypothetical protein
MRNIDSKVRTPRFDCFKFEFHSGAAATFATVSANASTAANDHPGAAMMLSPDSTFGPVPCDEDSC